MENFLGSLVSSVRSRVSCWCRRVSQDPVKVVRVTETFVQLRNITEISAQPPNLPKATQVAPLGPATPRVHVHIVKVAGGPGRGGGEGAGGDGGVPDDAVTPESVLALHEVAGVAGEPEDGARDDGEAEPGGESLPVSMVRLARVLTANTDTDRHAARPPPSQHTHSLGGGYYLLTNS